MTAKEAVWRIQEALELAAGTLKLYTQGTVAVHQKAEGDPVTEADYAVNRVLKEALVDDEVAWFSEESIDDFSRLDKERIWIVDPIDGTKEFLSGIPEWCVSIAYVENRTSVAGGIVNPMTGETFVGSRETGLLYNGNQGSSKTKSSLDGATVLASRSEFSRGEWRRFEGLPFAIQPMGSIAYKLARVAAGQADATWTLTPKHEWDVAAGVALVEAAHGFVATTDMSPLSFNHRSALIPGLLACSRNLKDAVLSWLSTQPVFRGELGPYGNTSGRTQYPR